MQQTEKYQFNLIESSDTFSPAPLNENMEKVEAQLDAARAADAALDARVQTLELRRFACGTYIGNGVKSTDTQIIELPFTPKAVMVIPITFGHCMCLQDYSTDALSIVPGGFKVRGVIGSMSLGNYNGEVYRYIAFA